MMTPICAGRCGLRLRANQYDNVCERHLSTIAIVRHTSSIQSGFEFFGLTPDERTQITSVIHRHEITACDNGSVQRT
jgi:hypothetical protein